MAGAFVMLFNRERYTQASAGRHQREKAKWDATVATIGPDTVVAEFQRRRKRLVPFALGPLSLAVLSFLLSSVTAGSGRGVRGPGNIFLIAAGFVLIAFAVIFAGLTYRCPVCSRPPWTQMPGGKIGVSLNPSRCPTCGAKLS